MQWPALGTHDVVQSIDSLARGHDLSLDRKSGQPGREIDGVAKQVTVTFQHGPELEADTDAEFGVSDRHQFVDGYLHLDSGARGGVGRREVCHDLVANRLDDAPALIQGLFPEDIDTLPDGSQGNFVAGGFIEFCAAADIGE